MMIRYSAAGLMKDQAVKRPRDPRLPWKVRRDEASQELFFACLSFVLLLVAALADVTLKL
jgi:hypothetical protein